MADVIAQHEISDNRGSTENFSGTATTTPANVPSAADKKISGYLVIARDKNLQVSDDGGTTYFNMVDKGSVLSWDAKGEFTQLKVKTSVGTAGYDIKINFEEF